MAPTTPFGLKTMTSPFGNIENSFDICRLAEAAGATFVARWTTAQSRQITRTVKKAIQKKGFSFIELMSQCPVQFGKKTGMGSTTDMMEYFKNNSVTRSKAKEMSDEELEDKFVVGEFLDIEKSGLIEELDRLRERIGKPDGRLGNENG